MTPEQDPAAEAPRNDLVVRARTDREAFGQLYDACYPGVFRYCFRRLSVRAVAEDGTSEVFLSAASEMPRFTGHGKVTTLWGDPKTGLSLRVETTSRGQYAQLLVPAEGRQEVPGNLHGPFGA